MKRADVTAGRYVAKVGGKLTVVRIAPESHEDEFCGWNERTWKLVDVTARRLRRMAGEHETAESVSSKPTKVARPVVVPMTIVQQMHAIELRETRELARPVRRREVPLVVKLAGAVAGFAAGLAAGMGPVAVALFGG